jgi:hypothetical protein
MIFLKLSRVLASSTRASVVRSMGSKIPFLQVRQQEARLEEKIRHLGENG